MDHNDDDVLRDDHGFWADDTRRPRRAATPLRRRQHRPAPVAPVFYDQDTSADDGFDVMVDEPFVATAPQEVGLRSAARSGGLLADVDPVVKRVGIMVLVAALLAPIAMALRSDDEPGQLRTVPGSVDAPVEETPAQGAPAQPAPAPEAVSGEGAGGAALAPTAAAAVSKPKVCTSGYKVRAGDFWIRIAKLHGLTLKQLLQANNARATTPIYPGRIVCLPQGVAPVTAAPATTAPATKPSTTKAPATTAPPAKAPATTAPVAKAPTTTARPAPATTTPTRTYTRDEVIAIIRQIWPDELEERAIQIAIRESNLIPTARNYCCYGLFQLYFTVHQKWLAQIGVTSSTQLFDPTVNAWAALTLYNRAGGWGPWQ